MSKEKWFNNQVEEIEREKFQLLLFEKVIQHGGVFKFEETLFKDVWNIKTIKAVEFTKDIPDEHTSDEWNSYVDEIKKAIGVDTYCEFIYKFNHETNRKTICGILAYFNGKNKEIKTKHFTEYELLYNILEKQYPCCGNCGEEVILNRKPLHENEHCHSCGADFMRSGKFVTVPKHLLKGLNSDITREQLIDFVKNFVGVFDTPASRLLYSNKFTEEVRLQGRIILKKLVENGEY
jgi:hypothetical protein